MKKIKSSIAPPCPLQPQLARSGKAGDHYRLQLAAYGLLLEETMGKPVRRGYLYLIPARQAVKVPLTPG